MIIQFVLIGTMALALVMTWRRFRQRVIPLIEALAWSALWTIAAIVVIIPHVTTRVAQFIGVGRGADAVTYISLSVLFLLVFKLFIQHEKMERKLTDVVRHEALRDLEQKY